MKTFFKRFFVLALALVFFAAPSISYAARPTATLIFETEGLKLFEYSPTSYSLTKGHSIKLEDTTISTGNFFVPAGNTFGIQVNLDNDAIFQLTVFNASDGLVYNVIHENNFASIDLPPTSVDANYIVLVTALNSLAVDSYLFAYYQN